MEDFLLLSGLVLQFFTAKLWQTKVIFQNGLFNYKGMQVKYPVWSSVTLFFITVLFMYAIKLETDVTITRRVCNS